MINPSPREFLEKFFPDGLPRGQVALYTTTLRRAQDHSYWFPLIPAADRTASDYRKSRQVRFSVALHDPQQALAIARGRRGRATLGTVRGCEGSATALSALWAVITWAAGGARSATGDLPRR